MLLNGLASRMKWMIRYVIRQLTSQKGEVIVDLRLPAVKRTSRDT